MEGVEETKKCGICDKDIEVSKFRMHDIGCSRQNYKCKDCGQCVAKGDKEEHDQEAHKEIECPDCEFKAQSFKFEGHPDKCPKKPRNCDFCDQTISFKDWQSHYHLCGSKTYQCDNCKDYVKYMDRVSHIKNNICASVIRKN